MEKEVIEKMMREACESYIQDYDFRYLVKEVVKEKMEKRVESYVNERIDEEIKKVLDEPVHIDNGWGDRRDYDSFEDLFKQTFNKKLSNDWKMNETIKRTIEDRVDELVKKKSKELAGKIQDLILSEIIKDEEKKDV